MHDDERSPKLPASSGTQDREKLAQDFGGDSACWLDVVCSICGILRGPRESHRPGCDADSTSAIECDS